MSQPPGDYLRGEDFKQIIVAHSQEVLTAFGPTYTGLPEEEEFQRRSEILTAVVAFVQEGQNIGMHENLSDTEILDLADLYTGILAHIYSTDADSSHANRIGNLFLHSPQRRNLLKAFQDPDVLFEVLNAPIFLDSPIQNRRIGKAAVTLGMAIEYFAYHPEEVGKLQIDLRAYPQRRLYPNAVDSQLSIQQIEAGIDMQRKIDMATIYLRFIPSPLPEDIIQLVGESFDNSLVGVAATGWFWRFVVEKYNDLLTPQLVLEELGNIKGEIPMMQLSGKQKTFKVLDANTPSSRATGIFSRPLIFRAQQFADYRLFRQNKAASILSSFAGQPTLDLTNSELLQREGGIFDEILTVLFLTRGNEDEYIRTMRNNNAMFQAINSGSFLLSAQQAAGYNALQSRLKDPDAFRRNREELLQILVEAGLIRQESLPRIRKVLSVRKHQT